MHHAASRLRGTLVALVILAASTLSSAHGTTLIRRSVAELTVLSEYVVEGTVTSVESRFKEAHKFVYTYVTVDVQTAYKGNPGATVVLEELGGEANGMKVTVPGTTEWAVGERVVLFLEYPYDNQLRVNAMEQGKFTVVTDPATGELQVTRPAEAELTYNWAADGTLDPTVDAGTGKRRYDTFVATILAYRDRLSTGGK